MRASVTAARIRFLIGGSSRRSSFSGFAGPARRAERQQGLITYRLPNTSACFMPMRVALTGWTHGPELHRTVPLLERGSRIAQMVVASYARVAWAVSADLEASARGDGGFGSTGFASEKTAVAGS